MATIERNFVEFPINFILGIIAIVVVVTVVSLVVVLLRVRTKEAKKGRIRFSLFWLLFLELLHPGVFCPSKIR